MELNSRTLGSWPEPKAEAQPLSHPGVPSLLIPEKRKKKSSWFKSVDHFRECGKYSDDPQEVLISLPCEYVALHGKWYCRYNQVKEIKVILDFPGRPNVPYKREEGVTESGRKVMREYILE